jgi:nicotinic acid mononucleotide adenylyltransferase
MHRQENSLIKAPCDIEQLLGVPLNASTFVLKQAYRERLAESPQLKSVLRTACNLASDSTYLSAFVHYGTYKAIAEAGFFDDGLDPGALFKLMDPNWLATPLEKLLFQLDQLRDKPVQDAPPVVLLSTGAFAPVHEGHIAMMDAAWKRLSREGYAVLGGYFSSSHDSYVTRKDLKAQYYHASLRERALNRALAGHDWLMADPWEALYTPCAINFTDVIRRLKAYLNRHITSYPPIEVAYVFGSDNAYFSRAFIAEGLAVCVERPGFEHLSDAVKQDEALVSSGRVLFTSLASGEATPAVNSSSIRAGAHPMLTAIERDVEADKEGQRGRARARASGSGSTPEPPYLIRNDALWAARIWRGLIKDEVLVQAIKHFTHSLSDALVRSFNKSYLNTHPQSITPIILPIGAQKAAAYELCEESSCINNDILTAECGISVGLSRLFSLSASQFSANALIERPESSGSLARLAALPGGRYTLIDDDIASGFTLSAIKRLLNPRCVVTKEVPLSRIAFQQLCPATPYEFWDVVDARDFLLGAYASGLVVRLFNNQIARAPYLSPYVSLASRANIPPDQERALSRDILRLNLEFFSSLGASLTLQQASAPFQNLMAAAGFSPADTLVKVCEWHLSQLKF